MLLARADALAVQLHMAEEELADLTALRRGRVRLAAYPSAAATLVPRAMAGLRARHPDIDVDLTEAEPPEALSMLLAGDVDLALVFSYGAAPVDTPGMRWTPLAEEPVALVVGYRPPRCGSEAADAEPPRRRAMDRRLRAMPRSTRCTCAPKQALNRAYVTSATTTSSCRTSSRSASASHCCHSPALEAYRHPAVTIREHASFGTRTYGIVHREGAELVPATSALVRELSAWRQ